MGFDSNYSGFAFKDRPPLLGGPGCARALYGNRTRTISLGD
jgi:hypothetical protein